MFISGLPDYDRQGAEQKTGLVAGRAGKDGQLHTTNSGKEVGSVSVPAYTRKDGTTAWLTVKGWGPFARTLESVRKGTCIFAAGRLSSREYQGHTYMDLTADFVSVIDADAPTTAVSSTAAPPDRSGFSEIEDDGDLPF